MKPIKITEAIRTLEIILEDEGDLDLRCVLTSGGNPEKDMKFYPVIKVIWTGNESKTIQHAAMVAVITDVPMDNVKKQVLLDGSIIDYKK